MHCWACADQAGGARLGAFIGLHALLTLGYLKQLDGADTDGDSSGSHKLSETHKRPSIQAARWDLPVPMSENQQQIKLCERNQSEP